jgi:DNA-binding transcriptional LysR family regulator
MLDDISLDQMRVFIAAAEAGSFSAAGRRLGRAQSVVSQTIGNLECRLGLSLFARDGRYPVLTEAGKLLLVDACEVAAGVDRLKARAKSMAGGLEAELSVAIDVMFPMPTLTAVAAAFGEKFPATPLRLYVEVLGGVAQAVLDGRAGLGVIGSLIPAGTKLVRERLLAVKMVFVAAPDHPLGRLDGPIPESALLDHVQLVLTDRTELSKGREFQVISTRTWRLADLGAKHEFLRAGLGWGGMPLALVAQDMAAGRLRELHLQDMPVTGGIMPIYATFPSENPPGPAGRWFIERLKLLGAEPGCAAQAVGVTA